MTFDLPLLQSTVDFLPDSEVREIMQNVITICSTVKGSVPLDREFGINDNVIDLPANTARAKLAAEYVNAVRKFEPRADVVKVSFQEMDIQNVIPVLSIKLNI